MASVKVRVGDELRRFSVARTATWTDVEAKVRGSPYVRAREARGAHAD